MMNSARARSILSFGILICGAIVFAFGWNWIAREPDDDEISPAFRQVLELNGKIWKKLYRASARNECRPPPAGKKPRVNGDVGLKNQVDASKWILEVAENPRDPSARNLRLNLDQIRAMPRTDTAAQFRCIEGWSEDMGFAGVKFSDFVRELNLQPRKYVGLVSVDGEYYVSIDWESMMHEQTLLAYEMNGETLRHMNGFPLRLAIPIKYGIKSLKQVGKIYLSDVRPPDYWAEQGYDWYAGL